MLGFSIQKLLFTVAVVLAVWYGFKIFGRGRTVAGGGAPKNTGQEKADGSLEMKPCEVCGDYVAAGASSCGRDDCPYG